MGDTKIQWASKVWNPVTGCTPISEGCAHCYAKRMATRLAGRCGYPADDPFRVTFHPERMEEPLRWKKPQRVFVCSMGDLFHENINIRGEEMRSIFRVMGITGHIYLLLTKRPERMKIAIEHFFDADDFVGMLSNVWLGVTAENQARADERIPLLLQTPAAVRFVSVEPMLGPVDLAPFFGWSGKKSGLPSPLSNALESLPEIPGLNWVICGGETGPGARPMHPDWPRSLRDQCKEAGVPFFFKQWGEFCPVIKKDEVASFLRTEPYSPPRSPDAYHLWPDGRRAVRVGKHSAGRLLGGREHNEFPGVPNA